MGIEDSYYLFEPVELEIKDFPAEGYILDIGGGGEGVIGRLKGQNVIAIDLRPEKMAEAAAGFADLANTAEPMWQEGEPSSPEAEIAPQEPRARLCAGRSMSSVVERRVVPPSSKPHGEPKARVPAWRESG